MTNRSRPGSPGAHSKSLPRSRGASARTPPAQKHATTADPLRQQQALSNQGTQGRMAPSWHVRSEEDEDADDLPPTLH